MVMHARPMTTMYFILLAIVMPCAHTVFAQQPNLEVRHRGMRGIVVATFPQFTVQLDAKRLVVQMKTDVMTAQAYEADTSVQSVSPVGDGTLLVILKPDADLAAVRAQFESNAGARWIPSPAHSSRHHSGGLCRGRPGGVHQPGTGQRPPLAAAVGPDRRAQPCCMDHHPRRPRRARLRGRHGPRHLAPRPESQHPRSR